MTIATPLTVSRQPIAVPPADLAPLDLRSLPARPVDAVYVHVPFCAHKCHYCDFYSITRQGDDRMASFVDRLLREADLWADRFPGGPVRPTTLFFGGGTPTLLPVPLMRRLLAGLRGRFDLSGVTEWTVEANPATVTPEYCRMLREAGVDRLSFGAQSFDRGELATLERHHNPDDVARSVSVARDAGFARLNVDLIYAVPGQTEASWARTLETAIALGTEHVSCYALTYEPNTPMAVKKRLGTLRATDDGTELAMMRHTRARLTDAGLPPYEISNYARPGAACRHNLLYWHGGSYASLGPSAASHVHGVRWKNRPHLGEWERAIDAGELPSTDVERLAPGVRAGELAMLMLRLSDGLSYDAFAARTGGDARSLFRDIVDRYARVGLLERTPASVRLTAAGLAVADAIAGEFLSAASETA